MMVSLRVSLPKRYDGNAQIFLAGQTVEPRTDRRVVICLSEGNEMTLYGP